MLMPQQFALAKVFRGRSKMAPERFIVTKCERVGSVPEQSDGRHRVYTRSASLARIKQIALVKHSVGFQSLG